MCVCSRSRGRGTATDINQLTVTEHSLCVTHCSESLIHAHQAHQPCSTCVVPSTTGTAGICAPLTSTDSRLTWHQGPSKPKRRLRAGSGRTSFCPPATYTFQVASVATCVDSPPTPLPGPQRWWGCPHGICSHCFVPMPSRRGAFCESSYGKHSLAWNLKSFL